MKLRVREYNKIRFELQDWLIFRQKSSVFSLSVSDRSKMFIAVLQYFIGSSPDQQRRGV